MNSRSSFDGYLLMHSSPRDSSCLTTLVIILLHFFSSRNPLLAVLNFSCGDLFVAGGATLCCWRDCDTSTRPPAMVLGEYFVIFGSTRPENRGVVMPKFFEFLGTCRNSPQKMKFLDGSSLKGFDGSRVG